MKSLAVIVGILLSAACTAQNLNFPDDIQQYQYNRQRGNGGSCWGGGPPKSPLRVDDKRFPTLPWSAFSSSHPKGITKNLYDIRRAPSSLIFVGPMYGLPFADGAIFCRMESFTQRNYKIKFSLHAGGYTE